MIPRLTVAGISPTGDTTIPRVTVAGDQSNQSRQTGCILPRPSCVAFMYSAELQFVTTRERVLAADWHDNDVMATTSDGALQARRIVSALSPGAFGKLVTTQNSRYRTGNSALGWNRRSVWLSRWACSAGS